MKEMCLLLILIIIIGAGLIPITVSELICNSDQLLCADGSNCISPLELCDFMPDCDDSSDEIHSDFCETLEDHEGLCGSKGLLSCYLEESSSQSYDYGGECMDLISACSRDNCTINYHSSVCDKIEGNRLKPGHTTTPKPTTQEYTSEFYNILEYLLDRFRESKHDYDHFYFVCPSSFEQFQQGQYIAFSIPDQLAWNEAQDLCESVSSRLAVLNEVHKFKKVLDCIQSKEFHSDYWIGGYLKNDYVEEEEENKIWTWLDGRPVEMGAPFWSLSFEDRDGPNMCSEDKKCIRPKKNAEGNMCLALLNKNQHYFSDEFCDLQLSPLCIFENHSIPSY